MPTLLCSYAEDGYHFSYFDAESKVCTAYDPESPLSATLTSSFPRWLKNRDLDTSTIPRCKRMEELLVETEATDPPISLARALRSNPFDNSDPNTSPPAHNPTLGMRQVYSRANAALRDTLVGIETEEDWAAYEAKFEEFRLALQEDRQANAAIPTVHDPPVIRHRGRPRDKRVTSASEGILQGGGGA